MCAPVPLLKTLSALSADSVCGTALRAPPAPPVDVKVQGVASRAVPWAWESVTSRRWRGARARGTAGRVPGTQDPRDGVSRDWRTHIIRYNTSTRRRGQTRLPRPGPVMRCIQRATSHTPARHNHESPAAARGPTAIRTTEPKTRRGSQTSEATRKWYNLLLEVQSFGNVDASSPTQNFLRSTSTTVQLYICWSSMWPVAKPHARTQPERALSRQVADV